MDGVQDEELTPVIFRDGRVIGWGRKYFDRPIEGSSVVRQSDLVKQGVPIQENKQVSALPVAGMATDADAEEFWVTDPAAGTDQTDGIPMYQRSYCIGAVVMGVCEGEILHLGPMPKRCYGEMLNGQCTGKAY